MALSSKCANILCPGLSENEEILPKRKGECSNLTNVKQLFSGTLGQCSAKKKGYTVEKKYDVRFCTLPRPKKRRQKILKRPKSRCYSK